MESLTNLHSTAFCLRPPLVVQNLLPCAIAFAVSLAEVVPSQYETLDAGTKRGDWQHALTPFITIQV